MRNLLFHLMDRSRNLQDFAYICIILLFSGSMYPICANSETTELLAELSTEESISSTLNVSGMPLLSTDESDSSTPNVSGMPLLSTDESDCSTLNVSGMPLLSTDESDSSMLNVLRMPLLSTNESDSSTFRVSGTKVSKLGTYRSLSGMPSLLVPAKELLHICLPHFDLLLSLRRNPNQSTNQPTEESVSSTIKVSGLSLLPTDKSVSSTFKVSVMPFSGKLSNPCLLRNVSELNRGTVGKSRDSILRLLQNKARLVKTNAEALLKTSLLPDCPLLGFGLPGVAVIPENERNNTPMDAFGRFYNSLLNHTAHVYFIVEQSKKFPTEVHCNPPGLQTDAFALAESMRVVMCDMFVFIHGYGEDAEVTSFVTSKDSIDQILNEELSEQPTCSSRAIRDCQTVHSTRSLAIVFLDYLKTLFSWYIRH